MSYHYFAASLPVLSLDSEPELSVDEFLKLCREHLTPAHLATLERILNDDPPCGNDESFAQQWNDFDTEIRNALVSERATRRSIESARYLRPQKGFRGYVQKSVSEAFAMKNPLESERALDRLRWAIIEDIQGHDPFAVRSLYAYAIKLRLAERWSGMNRDTGTVTVENITAAASVDLNSKQN